MPAGEDLSPADRLQLERAVDVAERFSGLTFSLFIGISQDEARGYAERLHAGLPDPDDSVLVMCDPALHALEIVTGSGARRVLDDFDCRLAAASMQTSFAAGDLVGGLVTGIQQLGLAARKPKTLHTAKV
ncbi:DUF5130 family protein [uncultured Friedmanniella sp.]|uniref:DUF5130 family protein n=1 Tax=uncultured Friedmanniella sp. TaxID=335381 RepID=UPI0035CC5580